MEDNSRLSSIEADFRHKRRNKGGRLDAKRRDLFSEAIAYLSFWADLATLELRLDFSSQCATVPGAAVTSVIGFVDSFWAFNALNSGASMQEE